MMNRADEAQHRRAVVALGTLLLAAAIQGAWNDFSIPRLTDYDAPGHVGYVLTLVDEHRLPLPLEGGCSFQPPLYYLLGAAAWAGLEPLGPAAIHFGLRTISTSAWLVMGMLGFVLARRLGAGPWPSVVAAALTLFVPCNQMAGAMIGNEALGAALAAAALAPILSLQRDPGRPRAALVAGVLTGLSLATKYSAVTLAAGAAVPPLRRDLDRHGLKALALFVGAVLLVAGPVYFRNWRITGSPLPMTRSLASVARGEQYWTPRPRRVADYLTFPIGALREPNVHLIVGETPEKWIWNPALQSVWSLAYTSMWHDAFGSRIPFWKGMEMGRVLVILGLAPTALLLFGLALAARRFVRSGGRSPDSPIFVMALAAAITFVIFTWRNPALVAAKGAYLLPQAVPAAIFFAQGAMALPPALRRATLTLSLAAALASAIVFTNGLVLSAAPLGAHVIRAWQRMDAETPTAHIGLGMNRLMEQQR